ncbi:MAG: LVIVD repeat-containing protein [Thermoplasmatota archaeon]
MRTLLITGTLAMMALAGCLDGDSDATDGDALPAVDLFQPIDYIDRQTASHPAFGFPTATDYTGFTGDRLPATWLPPQPVEVPETITGLELLGSAEGVAAGAGIAVFGHYAIVSGNGPGSIVDIADPLNPVKVADLDISVRDADVIAYPDGRLVAVMASNGPIHTFDITDPRNPIQLPSLEVSSHNAVVVPGTPIVYNAGSSGGSTSGLGGEGHIPALATGVTEIFDLTDPENPVRLDDFANGYGCHDITTFIDAETERYRAYCAGIEASQIWDIADPANPTVITTVPAHHGVPALPSGSVPLVLFSHLAMTNHDGTVLIVGDETGGGAVPPGCDVNAAGLSGPLGNLWFYDISDETSPLLVGWISPSSLLTEGEVLATCTAHFGRLIEDRDQVAVAFYGRGVQIVDFSDPAAPFFAASFEEGTDTWDAWYWQGYIFTGDLSRGLDVFKLT